MLDLTLLYCCTYSRLIWMTASAKRLTCKSKSELWFHFLCLNLFFYPQNEEVVDLWKTTSKATIKPHQSWSAGLRRRKCFTVQTHCVLNSKQTICKGWGLVGTLPVQSSSKSQMEGLMCNNLNKRNSCGYQGFLNVENSNNWWKIFSKENIKKHWANIQSSGNIL